MIEINGMKLSHPTDAYTKLWSAISREEKPSQKALGLLDRYFSKGSTDDRRLVVILMMDEMDYMVNPTHASLSMLQFFFVDMPRNLVPGKRSFES